MLGFLRWPNLLMIILFFVLADHFMLTHIRDMLDAEPALTSYEFTLLIADVLIVSICGYWMNDLADVDIDRINRPKRWLVLNPGAKAAIHKWLFVLGIAGLVLTVYLALITDKKAWIAMYPLVMGGLALYARYGKSMGYAGNVLVSAVIAAIPLLLFAAEQELFMELKQERPEVFVAIARVGFAFVLLMFFTNLARELVKDMEDLQGDQSVGARSVPAIRGLKFTTRLVVLHFAVIASVQACLYALLPQSPALTVLSILVVGGLILMGGLLIKYSDNKQLRLISSGLKWLMLIGMLQLIFLPSFF